MTCSDARGSRRYGSRHGRPVRTRTPNDGFAQCAMSYSIERSSGMSGSSVRCSSSTSTTTTSTARIAASTSAPPTTPLTLSLSAQATRSNVEAPAADSSTSTEPQPERPHRPTANKETHARSDSTRHRFHHQAASRPDSQENEPRRVLGTNRGISRQWLHRLAIRSRWRRPSI